MRGVIVLVAMLLAGAASAESADISEVGGARWVHARSNRSGKEKAMTGPAARQHSRGLCDLGSETFLVRSSLLHRRSGHAQLACGRRLSIAA
jgi:hypothetical protein